MMMIKQAIKKSLRHSFIFIGCVFLSFTLAAQSIKINEMVSSNSAYMDEDGDTPDWLELHNSGTQTVSLEGWFLSDDPLETNKWTLPNVSLAPNKYIRIWASSKDRVLEIENLHTNFKIASSSETLLLSNTSGTLIDQVTAENLPHNVSLGISKVSNTLVNYIDTTPGLENSNVEYLGAVTSTVEFSHEGGPIDAAINLILSGSAVGETIRYTTDSTVPTESALAYTSPIAISSTTVIRAKIFAPNYIPTKVYNKSFVFNANHEIDMVFMTVEEDDFFSDERGIYAFGNDAEDALPYYGANFWEDWERQVHFSFYEKGNNASPIEYNGGVKIFGGWSRSNAQRSLSLFARSKYGSSEFDYPFFEELDYDKFQALVLRNSGGDWLLSSIKDITLTSIMRGSGLDFQEHNSVATYINGEYWGLYHMREKINEHMLASKHDVDADSITLLANNAEVVEGSNVEYLELMDYVSNTDLSNDQNFEYVEDRVDIMNYALYQASNMFYANIDWPGNNIKYWKPDGGKWRWIMFDTDDSFGITDFDINMFDFALEPNGPVWPNPPWATVLFRKMNENRGFVELFINRYADELNTRFLPNNLKTFIENSKQAVASELEAQYERWNGNLDDPFYYLIEMNEFADARGGFVKENIMEQYNLPAFHPITINNNTTPRGFVRVNNNLKIQEATWTGDYFETIAIELTAVAEPGYVFTNWSGDVSSTEATISINLLGANTVTANFEEMATESIVINEINYKSGKAFDSGDWIELYNPNAFATDISNWQLKDDDDTHVFNVPAGTTIQGNAFIVLVKDTADFTSVFPNITNIVGDIDFGFGGSDAVRLYNAEAVLQDEVIYDSTAPWVECPDGTGQTLELISPELDNSLAINWNCISTNGTPNASNLPTLSIEDNEHAALKLFPNPVGSTLNLSGVSNIVSVQITNLAGQQIMTLKSPTDKINVDALQKGFYLIKIQSENRESIHKLLKK